MNDLTTLDNDSLIELYDIYSTLFSKSIYDEIRLSNIEKELDNRQIEYKLEDVLLSLFKQHNENKEIKHA
jgi:hypothetical protein